MIDLPWWIVPLIYTFVSFAIANSYKPKKTMYFNFDLDIFIMYGIAIITSLIIWLVAAVLFS